MEKNTNFAIGDHIYFYYNREEPINKGTIQDICTDPDGRIIFHVRWFAGGTSFVSEQHIFKTEQECIAYTNALADERLNEYMSEITDMDSLINFCISQIRLSGHHDHVAVTAIERKYEIFKKGE